MICEKGQKAAEDDEWGRLMMKINRQLLHMHRAIMAEKMQTSTAGKSDADDSGPPSDNVAKQFTPSQGAARRSRRNGCLGRSVRPKQASLGACAAP
jgi:hypothetical protein